MCVADARWFFYRARYIVVGVAEFIGEEFNLVRTFLYSVIEHCEPCWGGHSLASCNRNEVEFVSIPVGNGGIDHSTSCWVCESSRLSSEDSCIHALARVDVHELAGLGQTDLA